MRKEYIEIIIDILRKITGLDWILYLLLGYRYFLFRFLVKFL